MRRVTALFSISWLILAGGCAALPAPQPAPAPEAPKRAEARAETQAATRPAEGVAGPGAPTVVETRSPLDTDLLFELLVAEFAGQRGALDISASNYLDAAKQSQDAQVARRAAQVAIYGRDYDMALDAARLWAELAPDDLEARQSLAALYLKSGQLEAATTEMTAIIAATEDRAQAFALIGNLLIREPDSAAAVAAMQKVIRPYGDDPDALFALAHLASNRGHHEQALATLDRLLEAEPELVKALVTKATVLHRMGEKEGAVASIRSAVELEPKNADLRLTYARLLVDSRRLDEARVQFEKLEKALPDNADVVYALGLLAMQAENLDAAERYFRKLLAGDSHSNEAAYALGQIAELREDPDQAMQWYRSVGEGENYMDAQLRVAQLILERDGLDAARAHLASLELGDPEQRLRRYLAEGALLTEAERFEQAMSIYSDGLASFADNTDLLYARAMAAERIDRIDLLERDLRAVLQLEPDNTQALNALGYTLADRTDRYQEARELIERAFEQAPDDPAVIDSMGWVLYRLGENKEAADHLRRALNLQRDGEIAAHLGEVLWVSGDKQQAREVWNQALEYAPDHEILRSVIERFTGKP